MAIFNVRSYGALGNGVKDDTAAIQSAVNAANAVGGGDVYVPSGVYIVSGNDSLRSTGAIRILDNVHLYGDGMGQTELKVKNGWDGVITGIVRSPYGAASHDYSVRDLTLNGNRGGTTGKIDGFFCGTNPGSTLQDRNVTLERVEIKNCSGYGFDPHEQTTNLTIRDSVSHGNGLDGFTLDYQINATIENNVAYGNDRHGFNVVTSSHDMVMNHNSSYQNGGAGITVQRGSENVPWPTNITVTDGNIWGNLQEGVLIKLSDNVTLHGMRIYGNAENGIRIYGGTNNTVTDNRIYNNSQAGYNKYDEVRIQDYPDTLTGSVYASHHNIIAGNTIYGDAPIRARNGVYENDDTSDFNIAADNVVTGVAGQTVVLTGGSSSGQGAGGGASLRGTDSADRLSGTHYADSVSGGEGADTLSGFEDGDTLYGGGGGDRLYGNGGADSLAGGGSSVDPNDAADTIYGGGGSDTIYGNGGDDSLFGGGSSVDPNDAADTVYGGGGSDTIYGNGGADTIHGNEGNDTLHGGVGNDVYVFGDGGGDDLVLQFENPGTAAGDTLHVSANINGLGIAAASDVLSRIAYADGQAVIDLGSGHSVTIDGIAEGTLTADDFTIG